ncbi:MAG: acyltransferase [Pseudomonadota bacterium]
MRFVAALLAKGDINRLIGESQDIELRNRLKYCGNNVGIRQPVVIEGPEGVIIEDDVSIAAFVHFWGQGGISIGKGTMIASHVAITSLTHDPNAPVMRETLISGSVEIGENVWIGAHSVIFSGVSIGENSVVAAGSVVRTNVPPNTVFAGVPAREVRKKQRSS